MKKSMLFSLTTSDRSQRQNAAVNQGYERKFQFNKAKTFINNPKGPI